MKRLIVLLAVIGLLTIGGRAQGSSTPDCRNCNQVYGGIPLFRTIDGALASDSLVVLESTNFIVGYSEDRMNPLWVSYRVCPVTPEGSAPSFGWRLDTRTSSRVSDTDYRYTGYQRGHMAPKATIFHCYGDNATRDTFVLTNACPQTPEFNNGPWKALEELVRRRYGLLYEGVWVTTGPIFDDCNGRTLLVKDEGHEDWCQKPVEVPDAFFKIIIDLQDGVPRALAFIINHDQGYGYGEGTTSTERLSVFLTSINEIESLTGLDFFWALENELEATLEASVADSMWLATP